MPAGFLAGMRPWSAATSGQTVPQWNPLLWDGIAQFYPWRVHYSRSIADGLIPLWNPHQFCGAPFAANAQTAIFYPLSLLFVLFAPVRAFGVSAALHLFLAGLFAYLLSRALGTGRFGAAVAGVTFAFSAFMIVWLELPTLVNVVTWLPLALYLILRASDGLDVVYAVLAGVAVGLSVLAGHFQVASYVVGAVALWWIWLIAGRARQEGVVPQWRRAALAVISFAALLLIAAPQILPTVELAGMSHRVREVTSEGYARYVSNGIPARNLITLFVPNFYGNPSVSNPGYWGGSADLFMERAFYIGVLPLVLCLIGAVFGIRRRGVGFFVVLGVLSLLFAFGTAVNAIPYYLVPGSSALGGPNRVIVIFCFSAAMLAGFGAQWFVQRAQEDYPSTKRKIGWRALVVACAIFVAAFLSSQFVATAGLSQLGLDSSKVMSMNFGQYLSFASTLIAGLGVLALYTAGFLPKPLFAALALAVIVADLFSFGIGFNPNVPVSQVYPETSLIRWIKRDAPDTRLMPINDRWSLYTSPDAVLPPNAAMVYGFYDMQGYDSLFPKRYKDFVNDHLGADSSPVENGNILFIKKLVSNWPQGTAGVVLSKGPVSGKGISSVSQLDGVRVYDYANYESTYLLPHVGRAWIADRNTNEVDVNVDTDNPSRLILAEAYYPGWQAEANGAPKPVFVAQQVFRSVDLPPGSSTVKFRFLPGTYVVGAFLGLLGAVAAGIAIGIAIGRRWQS